MGAAATGRANTEENWKPKSTADIVSLATQTAVWERRLNTAYQKLMEELRLAGAMLRSAIAMAAIPRCKLRYAAVRRCARGRRPMRAAPDLRAGGRAREGLTRHTTHNAAILIADQGTLPDRDGQDE
jgi:hypothetical protein